MFVTDAKHITVVTDIMSVIRCTPFKPRTNATYKYCDDLIEVTVRSLSRTSFPQDCRLRSIIMPTKYARIADSIANFEVRSDDIWLVTFPKCGTTWTQEMIRLLLNNLNYDDAAKKPLDKEFAFLEKWMMFDVPDIAADGSNFFRNSVDLAGDRPSPRLIKTHLPIELLPAQLWTVRPRIVYTARNPKDTAVSFFHHYRNIHRYAGTFDDFMAAFLADEVIYSPFSSHVYNFWTVSRTMENVLFLTYEDMKTNMIDVLHKTQTFFNKSFTVDELRKLDKHLHVNTMRHNNSANNSTLMADLHKIFVDDWPDKDFQFVRKGIAGSFKDEMSAEQIEMFDAKTRHEFADVNFRFSM